MGVTTASPTRAQGAQAGRHLMTLALLILATVAGLALLWVASDKFVSGSSALAKGMGVSPLVVGVVVMGFGTSAPELVVSSVAALSGSPEVGIGNVVGSNLANLTLVLGVAAVMAPLTVSSKVLRREVFFALGATIAFAIAIQGGLERWEGALLLTLLVAALGTLIRGGKRASVPPGVTPVSPPSQGGSQPSGAVKRELARTILSLVVIVVGADLLVRGALGIADLAGLSGGFVGVTIVAFGTSLPELATAIAAGRRGETSLIIGNLLGSNIFNGLAVGGAILVLAPGPLNEPNLTSIGAGAMVAAALLALVFMRTGHRVGRREGVLLLVGYVAVLPLLW